MRCSISVVLYLAVCENKVALNIKSRADEKRIWALNVMDLVTRLVDCGHCVDLSTNPVTQQDYR